MRRAGRLEPTDSELEANQNIRERDGYAANPFCKVCGGAGFLYGTRKDGSPDYDSVITCKAKDCLDDARLKYQMTHEYLEIHGVTERLQTFERFRRFKATEETYKAFHNLAYGKTNYPFLLCTGNTGCGKTHLCQALTKVLNSRDIQTYYYQVPRLESTLKQAIETKDVESWTDALCKMRGLVLDDFGSESFSDWGLGKLQEIIDMRWTHKLITVMATNKSLTDLQQISPRIYSRMCDQEMSVVVENQGSDYRTTKRRE